MNIIRTNINQLKETKTMKQLLLITCLILLTACGGGGDNSPEELPPVPPEELVTLDFTKISSSGLELTDSSPNWSCVKDNSTGLIWGVKTNDGGLQDKDWTYSWYLYNSPDGVDGAIDGGHCEGSSCDTSAYIAAVNEQGLCGYNDWRLPTANGYALAESQKELQSIMTCTESCNGSQIYIDTNYFPYIDSFSYYRSSSLVDNDASKIWVASFKGFVVEVIKTYGEHVMLVRDSEAGFQVVSEIDIQGSWNYTVTGSFCDGMSEQGTAKWIYDLGVYHLSTQTDNGLRASTCTYIGHSTTGDSGDGYQADSPISSNEFISGLNDYSSEFVWDQIIFETTNKITLIGSHISGSSSQITFTR